MFILAIESSAKPASVAVYEKTSSSGKLLGQYYQNNGFSHSRTLLSMAEALLLGIQLKPADMGLIAVANGPGSFTGVRIGVSAAKGLALGLDILVCGVSTLEAIAYQTGVADNYSTLQTDVVICPIMDARRSQVYNALFTWNNGTLIRLREDRAISLEELAMDLRSIGKPCMPVGDGAYLLTSEVIDGGDIEIISPCPLAEYQTAYGVALAALFAKPIPSSELEPVYLRPSQAEREYAITHPRRHSARSVAKSQNPH